MRDGIVRRIAAVRTTSFFYDASVPVVIRHTNGKKLVQWQRELRIVINARLPFAKR
jgi:hypothetical protein